MRKRLKSGLWRLNSLVIITITLAPIQLASQQPTGSIEGTVTDSAGAVLPGAKVTIKEVSTGREIAMTANGQGVYQARALPTGEYTVKVEQSGFSPALLEEVKVLVGQVTNGSVSLKPGGGQEIVTVSANNETQVDSIRHTVDGVIRAQQIEQLPLNHRNFLELARLEPGVIVSDGGSIDPTKVNAFRAVGIGGRGGTGTRVQFDGIDVTDETVGTTTANLSDDAVSEFQVSRSSFDLSTSLTTSGAINVVTRSGSNEVHGSAFYFGRNQEMAAAQATTRTLDANGTDAGNPPFHRHQIGFRAGGPVIEKKVFWFANWERFYQADNFHTDPASVTFFPQMAGDASFPVGIRYASGRLDWNVSDSVRAFYRFNHSWDRSTGAVAQSPFQNLDWTNVHVAGADITQSRMTHSLRFGYVNFNNNITSQELTQFPFLRTPDGIPVYVGVGDFQLGPNGLAPQQTYQDNFQTKYDGSYILGKHTFRYGGEVNRIVLGGFANFAGPLAVIGDFSADPGGTRDQVISRGGDPQDPLEYPLITFSTGPANGFFTVPPAHGYPHGGNFNWRTAWYVSDTWRLRPNLTLNLGTRWEYDTGYFSKEKQDGARRPAILGQIHSPSLNAPKFPKDRFGPSIGFAWDPFNDGRTVIRGGFYLAYEMNIANNTIFNEFALIPPGIGPDFYNESGVFGPDGTPINVDGKHADGNYEDLIGRPIKDVLPLISKIHLALNAAYRDHKFDPNQGQTLFEIAAGNTIGGIFPGDFKVPYSMQFNIGVQRQFQRNVLSVDYVRNHAVGLPFLLVDYEKRRDASTLNVQAARDQVASVLEGQPVDQWIAANPTETIAAFGLASDSIYAGLTSELTRARIMSGGYSLYSALQAKLVGRFSNKLWLFRDMSYQVSYALGQSLATCGSGRVEFLNNTCDNRDVNNKAYFGHSSFSLKHIISAGVVTTIPGGFRVSQLWSLSSRGSATLFIPGLGAITGADAMFTTDLNGDGGTGPVPRGDLLPGLKVGDWGRKVSSFKELNQMITAYNQNIAGQLTPEGRALVQAGIFTEEQLMKLKAVLPTIPLVPETNPNPFASKPVSLDLRITRPIHLERAFVVHNLTIEPYFEVFNAFNYRGHNAYAGLGADFGSLNYDYAAAGDLGRLKDARAFAFGPRIIQLGFRASF